MVYTTKTIFALTFSCSLLLGFGGAWVISRIAGQVGLVDKPGDRSSHHHPTPRGGGAGILGALIFSGLILDLNWWFWVPASGLAIFSFGDDFFRIPPSVRLCGQFLAAILFLAPSLFHPAVFSAAVVAFFFWVVFIVGTANFYNFMDGIDGMAGITGVVGFLLLGFFGFVEKGEIQLSLLSLGLAAACLGFLPFNIPRARVFLGDVGSILLGFMFGVLIFSFTGSFADFLVLVCFLFPFYADTLTTLHFRWRRGEKLFQAHRKHLYQVLTNEMGWAHLPVSVIYGTVQLGIGILALACHATLPGWVPLFGLLIFLSLVYIFIARIVRTRNAR